MLEAMQDPWRFGHVPLFAAAIDVLKRRGTGGTRFEDWSVIRWRRQPLSLMLYFERRITSDA